MARFYGAVGYGVNTEIAPGVWEDTITEQNYYGTVIKNSRAYKEGETLHSDISVGNSISIVADQFANHHFFAMRYIRWAGTLWVITNVDVESPRLILRLGGVYHGPTPVATTTP